MLRGPVHRAERAKYEIVGYVFVKQVAHGVNKNDAGGDPSLWFIDRRIIKKNRAVPAAIAVNHLKIGGLLPWILAGVNCGRGHRGQSFGHTLRITILAAGTQLSTANDRIPCRIRPLD